MPGLSDSQFAVIRTLIDTAPDAAIRSLDAALASETRTDTAMGAIRDLVSVEAGERRARNQLFAPLAGLFPLAEPVFEHEAFPSRTLGMLWRALKVSDPDRFQAGIAASQSWEFDEASPLVFDELTAAAAAGLRQPAGTPFADCAKLLEAAEEGAAEAVAEYLDLCGLAREAHKRLPDWIVHMSDERAAQVRLAFKDATAVSPEAGPRFLELMICRLDEPWQILRVVSALMENPSDAYLAASELAHVGERLMADIDKRLDDLTAFDPFGGVAAGSVAADAVRLAVAQIGEFELSIDLKKDGPWGRRIAKQKQTLALKVEALLAKADEAVDKAMPLKAVKFGSKTRGAPNYRHEPDARAVSKAEGMLSFLAHVRGPAATGGFASLRAKTIEKLDDRLDRYVEDVLDHLRAPDAEQADVARRYLDIAANLVGLYRDQKAAEIVRRRAAA